MSIGGVPLEAKRGALALLGSRLWCAYELFGWGRDDGLDEGWYFRDYLVAFVQNRIGKRNLTASGALCRICNAAVPGGERP